VLFSSSRKRARARAEEKKEEEGAETHKTLPYFLFEEIQKKDQQTQERRVLSRATEKTPKKTIHSLERERKRERGGTPVLTLHTRKHHHHGTQTNLETVHLQNDRVRAFIKPGRRCSNVQHRHRGVEIRELARVVRA